MQPTKYASQRQTPAERGRTFMTTTFFYGDRLQCEVELGECSRIAGGVREAAATVADPAAAVRNALANPAGYPPLAAATVPGDRVAVTVADDVPERDAVLTGAIAGLLDAGVEAELITVVAASDLSASKNLQSRLAQIGARGVTFEQHDPGDDDRIAMIGVNRAGEPLRINRTVAEADLVLPIGSGESTAEGEEASRFIGLFPQFSNRETINRLKPHGVKESGKQRANRKAEIDDAGWKLGVGMTIRVVAGAGGTIAGIEAGDPTAVDRATQQRTHEVWDVAVERPGDLVVVAIVGDDRQQTWDNLARALRTAESALSAGGAIAVCSTIAALPSRTFSALRDAVDFEEAQAEIARTNADDAAAALALAQALERGPVYLRSQLPPDVVESLGMTPFDSDQELSRLAAMRGHCVLIEDAQRVTIKPAARRV